MKRNLKIAIGIVLILGFIAITSNQLMSRTTSVPPYEKDPDDPGNSPGPGLGSIPLDDFEFKFICEDTILSNINLQL